MSGRVLSTSRGTHAGAFAPTDWTRFLSLALIWGSSFVLIAEGLDAFEPGVVTWVRIVSGAVVLASGSLTRSRREQWCESGTASITRTTISS